jgi:hypothetical protein
MQSLSFWTQPGSGSLWEVIVNLEVVVHHAESCILIGSETCWRTYVPSEALRLPVPGTYQVPVGCAPITSSSQNIYEYAIYYEVLLTFRAVWVAWYHALNFVSYVDWEHIRSSIRLTVLSSRLFSRITTLKKNHSYSGEHSQECM